MAATCEYNCNDEEIRDQFVCSCFYTKLREKYLRMPGLTVEKISKLGLLYEQSKAQAKEIADNKETEKEIHFVERGGKTNNSYRKFEANKSDGLLKENVSTVGSSLTQIIKVNVLPREKSLTSVVYQDISKLCVVNRNELLLVKSMLTLNIVTLNQRIM